MSLTAGVLSKVSVGSTKASLSATAASGGTGPYTQQWYRSTTSGFTPGGGNIIAGATGLTLNDTGLLPGTQYYYEVIYTDVGASATIGSAQLNVATQNSGLSQNQFQQAPFLGQADQQFNYNTKSAQIDSSSAGGLIAGQAVKIVAAQLGGVPKVVECSADSDNVWGFICYDIKTQVFGPLDKCELSQKGNVMYLYGTGTIARGAQVALDITTKGGVSALVSTRNIVGFAYDGCGSAGGLIRVEVSAPSFTAAP